MEATDTKRVRFTMDNIGACQCMVCPVQVPSVCTPDDDMKLLRQMGSGTMTPDLRSLPRLYCASGTATCGDLDFGQQCLCPKTCAVYRENGLGEQKYCQRGSAAEIG